VLRAAEETETAQENINDWLQLDERNRAIFCFINPDYLLVSTTFPQLIRISESLL
jgi:hypothetical protein